jgi:PAS domain S-box-containing protein
MPQPISAAWLAEFRDAIADSWTGLREKIGQFSRRITLDERRRLGSHAFALAAVAVALFARWLFVAPESLAPFLFFHAAIGLSAWYGGLAAATVASLASALVARVTSDIPLSAAVVFALEGLLIAAIIVRIVAMVQKERRRVAVADDRIRELKSIERQGRLVETAFGRLEARSSDTIIAILDSDGRIRDWGAGAARLYGYDSQNILGTSAAALFGSKMSESGFAALLSEARSTVIQRSCRQRRLDGTEFDANVEIRPMSKGGVDGFTVVVHDQTPQQRWDVLREEADVAQAQLAALQNVTDPFLNTLGDTESVTTILNRLREAIQAEGVALVHFGGRFRPRVFCASEGVQGHTVGRPRTEIKTQPHGRTLLIHNDSARVAEMSAAQWPEQIASLIAVPVVRAGATQAVVEVVNARGRRATEWEIALIQVVAARIAGLVRDEVYADTGAVA